MKHLSTFIQGFIVTLFFLAFRSEAQYRGEPIGGTSGSNTTASLSSSNAETLTAGSNGITRAFGNSTAKSPGGLPEFINDDGQKYQIVSFAQLASFTFETVPRIREPEADPTALETDVRAQVPEVIKSLSERSIALTGFMLPVRAKDGLTADFLLLRNQSACCYGVMPNINEWVVVRTTGKGVKVTLDTPVTVLGTFHVGASSDTGSLTSIYQLDCVRLINPTN